VILTPESLPSDLAAAHAMILAERAARLAAEADRSSGAALIAQLKLHADSDGSRPPVPTRSRPAFRFDVGHHSGMKPASR